MKLHDVVVIGGGPVGSYIAQRLSRLGYRVVVVEKNAQPGDDICCTGILSQECLSALALDGNLVLRQVSSAKFFCPSGKCLRLCREGPVAAIADRGHLDISLAKQAQKAGADYLFRAIVTDIISEPNAVKVKIDSQDQETIYKARVAIIATGFGSTLLGKLGLGEIKHFVLGAQAEVYINGVDEVEVYFDQNLAPGGFAWLVPTREGKGLAGLLTRHQPDFYLRNFLNTLSSHGKLTLTEVVPQYGIIPLRPLPRTYADRILVVGEAAGQVKPTTGGGIYYGLLCADIAAEVLHQAFLTGDFSSSRLSAYQKQWHALLGRELQIGHWARWVYSRLNNHSINHLFHIAAQNGIADFVTTKDFSFDFHSRLILKVLRQPKLLFALAAPTLLFPIGQDLLPLTPPPR